MKSLDTFRSGLRSDDAPSSDALARGLGWFSLARGAAEVAIPRLLARGIGIEPSPVTSLVTRLMGARELAAGVAVLLNPRSPLPLWARVAGDAFDLALLGLASTRRTSGLRLAGAIAAVGGVTALDIVASIKAQRKAVHPNRPVMFSVTINKPTNEVYARFRDFARLPEVMDYLERVTVDGKRSHWVAKPFGGTRTVAWDAELTEDIPGRVIAWQVVDSLISGRVTFATAPGSEATEVRVEIEVGKGHAGIAKWFAKSQVKGDLRRFKQVLETGEVLLSDATVTRKPHPAQPSEPEVIAKNPHVTNNRSPVEVQP